MLYDNYLQAQILSQEQETAAQRVEAHEMLMHELELEGLLDRRLEALPASDDLAERQRQGRGLTRPELAVLLAYAKRSLYPKVLASAIPDDPALDASCAPTSRAASSRRPASSTASTACDARSWRRS